MCLGRPKRSRALISERVADHRRDIMAAVPISLAFALIRLSAASSGDRGWGSFLSRVPHELLTSGKPIMAKKGLRPPQFSPINPFHISYNLCGLHLS